ncbi:MAG: hypothetical protein NTV94_11785, partial [Planctomycetota bacterium]|nr:hypothetical protein [Planctomycetota bacterium]
MTHPNPAPRGSKSRRTLLWNVDDLAGIFHDGSMSAHCLGAFDCRVRDAFVTGLGLLQNSRNGTAADPRGRIGTPGSR